MENTPQEHPKRIELIDKLYAKFSNDFTEMLRQYDHAQKIQLTEHLMALLTISEDYEGTEDRQYLDNYQALESALLKKYRSKLQPYVKAGFEFYFFEFGNILAATGIITDDEAKKHYSGFMGLFPKEVFVYFTRCGNLLEETIRTLYLNDTGGAASGTESDNTHTITDEPDKDITKARQVLAIYYLLNGFLQLKEKNEVGIASIARFIHLLTGTKYTSIQNSEIYKKYQRMPNYKKGTHLIADLKFILPYFEELNFDEVVKLINAEIARELKELPWSERRKYDI